MSLNGYDAKTVGRRAGIFLRGLAYVSLTSANVSQIASGHFGGGFVLGTAISVLWWNNAWRASHDDDKWLRWCYGAGAGLGTVLGMAAARWFYR